MRIPLAIAMLGLALNAWAAPETYRIDDAHSFANWSIRHLVGRVSGTFNGVKGTLTFDPANPNTGAANVAISLYSLNSGHRERDVHLLTSDFFDASVYPEMRFVASGFRSTGKDTGVMTGQLTLHGATRQVEIPYRILGTVADPWNNLRAAFEGRFTLGRSDYGITKFVNGGNGIVGNEVDITLLVEAVKLGPDGQPLQVKPALAAQPTPEAAPARQDGKTDLKELIRGILK